MKKILVVGSSNVDFVLGVKEMPKIGETIRGISFANIPGGKGANQACACGKLGGDCTFLSCVGLDSMGDLVLNSLKSANVDVSAVQRLDNTPTGMAFIMVDQTGDNSIVVIPGANGKCKSRFYESHLDLVDQADIVLTQLETPLDDIYALLKQAKAAGKVTVLNPAPAPDNIPDDVLAAVDWITPNETELSRITGMPADTLEEISAAAAILLGKGVGNVLVTIGSRGVFLCSKTEQIHYPTIHTTAVDTTAAGDTFNAAFTVALSEGKTVADAIRFANTAASISVTRKGAQTSIPSREEVDIIVKDNGI